MKYQTNLPAKITNITVCANQAGLGVLTYGSVHHYQPTQVKQHVSLTMTRKGMDGYSSDSLHPIFVQNLPEGFNRRLINEKLARYAKINDIYLLALQGDQGVGMLSYKSELNLPEAEPLSLSEILSYRSKEPLFPQLLEKYYLKTSLAGMQPKVSIPNSNTVQSYRTVQQRDLIVKSFDSEFPLLTVNEFVCMQAAQHCGLEPPKAYLSENLETYVVERFDRSSDGTKLGYEDFTTLMKKSNEPSAKYTSSYETLLNVHPEIVRHLGLYGWLKIEKKKVNGFIKNVTTVSDFEVFNNSYILVGTLAHKFNVNSTNLAEKLKHYGIHPIAGPRIDGFKTTLFYKNDVARITRAMITSIEHYHTNTGRLSHNRTKQVYYESDSELYISLKEAAQELHISPAKVAVLIQNHILKKDESNHKIIMVEHTSIHALTKALQRTDFISLQEAAKQLDCAINWLHINWIRTGCMKCYDYIYWKFVSTDDINKVKIIQKEYMTAIDASKLLSMHRTHIINLKAQGKINSVSFGESNPINLYRRKDVLSLLKQKKYDNE